MFVGSNTLSQFSPKNLSIWFSMSFQAGAINAGGFLACHRFVTHTTGFATYFGTEMAQGHLSAALGMLSVPIFFLIGAAISGYFVDRRLTVGERPLYHLMFAFIAFAMLIISIAGNLNLFGIFGENYEGSQDYILLALLCLCSGLQNGTITSASGTVVRTTHLTGITTDLGIGLVRAFGQAQNKKVRYAEGRANVVRVGLIASFAMGSTVSSVLFFRYQYMGFVCPALISFGLFIFSLIKLKNPTPPLEVSNARVS